MYFNTETLVVLVLVIFAFVSITGGASANPDNLLVWGPAWFIKIPFELLQAISAGFPILIPFAIIGLLVYFNVLLKLLGEPIVVLSIVLFLFLYLWL